MKTANLLRKSSIYFFKLTEREREFNEEKESIASSSCNELQCFTSIKEKIHFIFGRGKDIEVKVPCKKKTSCDKKAFKEKKSLERNKKKVVVDK